MSNQTNPPVTVRVPVSPHAPKHEVRVKVLPTGEYAVEIYRNHNGVECRVLVDAVKFTCMMESEWDALPDVTLAPVPDPTHARDLRADGQLMRERDAARALVRDILDEESEGEENRPIWQVVRAAVAEWDRADADANGGKRE